MADDEELVVGDKVELVKEPGKFYKTMIEDMYGAGSYLVGIPSQGGVPMALYQNDEVLILYYRESGRYVVPAYVMRLEKSGGIRCAVLLQKGAPHRDQRRGAFRLRKKMKVNVFGYNEGDEEKDHAAVHAAAAKPGAQITLPETLDTVGSSDISITGVSLTTKKKYEHNDRLLLKLHFSDANNNVTHFFTCAKVVRVSPGNDRGTFNIGLHYFGHNKSMNEFLSKYMFTEQQKLIKRKRLGTD